MKKWPRNPRPPIPEFVTAIQFGAYGWKCDKHGIMVFGNSREEAVSNWSTAYQQEYFTT